MSALRSRLLAARRTHRQLLRTVTAAPAQRPLSFSAVRKAGDSHTHEEPYDPPGGWLFGVKPGEKYQNEGWENIWFYGYFGSLLFGVIGYCYKPDTSIQTWALEEARRRLEVEGILEDPEKKG